MDPVNIVPEIEFSAVVMRCGCGNPDSQANNTAVTVATVDNSVTYYLFLSAACGTSNSLNLINTQMIKVYGEN